MGLKIGETFHTKKNIYGFIFGSGGGRQTPVTGERPSGFFRVWILLLLHQWREREREKESMGRESFEEEVALGSGQDVLA